MAKRVMFPARPDANPTIYAYSDKNPQYDGMLKVGYTIKTAATRVAEQYPILKPGDIPYVIHVDEPAIRKDGSVIISRWDEDGLHNLNAAVFLQCTAQNGLEGFLLLVREALFQVLVMPCHVSEEFLHLS